MIKCVINEPQDCAHLSVVRGLVNRAFGAAAVQISSQELSADRPQTAGLVTQPFQTVTGDIVIWAVRPKRSVNPPLTAL